MLIKSVEYSKVFNLGNYSNEKIGVVVELAPDENAIDAFAKAKLEVEKSHKFFMDLPAYEQAKKVNSHPDDYTGREVKASLEVIAAFESNYPEYLSKFNIPVSRQLNEAQNDDDFPY